MDINSEEAKHLCLFVQSETKRGLTKKHATPSAEENL